MIYYYDRGGSRPVFTGKGAASIRATFCPMKPMDFSAELDPGDGSPFTVSLVKWNESVLKKGYWAMFYLAAVIR